RPCTSRCCWRSRCWFSRAAISNDRFDTVLRGPLRAMNARSPIAVVVTSTLVAVLLAGAAQLQAVRERVCPPGTETADALYVRSGTALRRLAGAYTALAADLYWIRTIQYYGSGARTLEQQAAQGPFVPAPPPSLMAVDEAFPLLYP